MSLVLLGQVEIVWVNRSYNGYLEKFVLNGLIAYNWYDYFRKILHLVIDNLGKG
jgi:hypothetical protein